MRGNGGGLLKESVNIVNVFVDKGTQIVNTKGRIKEWNHTYRALNNPIDLDIPLVILINELLPLPQRSLPVLYKTWTERLSLDKTHLEKAWFNKPNL